MRGDVFNEYLQRIKSLVHHNKIYLVIDQFGAHIGDDAKTEADSLIRFIPVPKGGTAEYQPLDRGTFGIMKKKGVAKWTRISHQFPKKNWDKPTAARIALESGEEIKMHHILKAWNMIEES